MRILPTLSDEALRHWATTGQVQILRWVSTMLGIPALCDLRGCRRARRCRGNPEDCGPRYAALVPEDALEGVVTLIRGKFSGLEFHELNQFAMADLVALSEWLETVETTYRGRRKRRPKLPAYADNALPEAAEIRYGPR